MGARTLQDKPLVDVWGRIVSFTMEFLLRVINHNINIYEKRNFIQVFSLL